jgi:hypothetical protein
MIKKKKWIFFLLLITGSLITWIFYRDEFRSHKITANKEFKINGRRIINPKSVASQNDLKKIIPFNLPSPHWQKEVEKSLKLQGGQSLKTISIEKVESLIWLQNNRALNVESLKINLKNDKNQEVSFRAMIDSSNGKILQTWDQPVVCPTNPRGEPGIKIDPRYFNN